MKCYYEMEVGEVLTIEMENRGFCRIKAVLDGMPKSHSCRDCILFHTDHCIKYLCTEDKRVAYGENIHFELVERINAL